MCSHIRVVFHCQEIVSWKLRAIPDAEKATMVTWEELEQAVTGGRMVSQMVNRDGGGGLGSGLGWGPRTFPFFTAVQYSIMWVFIIYFTSFLFWTCFMFFPQSYNKPCSNVTLTQVKVLIGSIPRHRTHICDLASFCQITFHGRGSSLDPHQQCRREPVSRYPANSVCWYPLFLVWPIG